MDRANEREPRVTMSYNPPSSESESGTSSSDESVSSGKYHNKSKGDEYIAKLKDKEGWNIFVEDVTMALMEMQRLHILFPDHDAVMPGEAAITRWYNSSKYAEGVELAMDVRSSKTVVNLTTGRIHSPRNLKLEPKDEVKSEMTVLAKVKTIQTTLRIRDQFIDGCGDTFRKTRRSR